MWLPDASRVGAGRLVKKNRLQHFTWAALFVVVTFVPGLNWSWLDAQARAVVVISSVLQIPVLDPGVKLLSGRPRVESHPVAGDPAYIVRPAGRGPWPAIFFVNGATPEGRKLPEVRRLAGGLARAGYLVVVPDLPGLRDGEITDKTRAETIQVARDVADRRDARGGKVGLVGVSTGATLALLAAENQELRGKISSVAGIAPYSNVRDVLDIATTDHYRDHGRLAYYEADPFLSYVVARSLIFALPPGREREELLSRFDEVSPSNPHPLTIFRERGFRKLGPQARCVLRLLANRNPRRFDALYAALPGQIRKELDLLSPLAAAGRINAPVELASESHDRFFPLSESYAVAKIAPDLRVTVTGSLHHAQPVLSLRDLPSLWRFDGFVVRSLRDIRENN